MSDFKTFRYAFVIRADSHDSRDDGTVRSMAGAGHGERTVQQNFGFDGVFTEQFAGNQADFDGTFSMRARWPDNDRAVNVELFHFKPLS